MDFSARVIFAALLCTSACGEDSSVRETNAVEVDASTDAALDWTNGGADVPEYSLGRLLISHRSASELSLFDLETAQLAARIPFEPRARVVAGGSGRYAYAFAQGQRAVRLFDPGQWLLSHIDHFHVIRGEHRFLPEQLDFSMLSSLRWHDGWVSAYGATSGMATFFQERSITAGAFAPQSVPLVPAVTGGVALISRAQLIASEGPELTQRSVLAPTEVSARFTGCSEPQGIAARRDRVFIGCREGLLALRWDITQELFVPELLPVDGDRVVDVRTADSYDGAVLQMGARSLGLLGASGAPIRKVELPAQVVAFDIRRQGATMIVLTADGTVHELDLSTATTARSTVLYPPLQELANEVHLVMSHAYAYVTDPRAPRVLALRLRTMQVEAELPLSDAPYDLAIVGVPATYTDDRE
jgi:hypothetical protein